MLLFGYTVSNNIAAYDTDDKSLEVITVKDMYKFFSDYGTLHEMKVGGVVGANSDIIGTHPCVTGKVRFEARTGKVYLMHPNSRLSCTSIDGNLIRIFDMVYRATVLSTNKVSLFIDDNNGDILMTLWYNHCYYSVELENGVLRVDASFLIDDDFYVKEALMYSPDRDIFMPFVSKVVCRQLLLEL